MLPQYLLPLRYFSSVVHDAPKRRPENQPAIPASQNTCCTLRDSLVDAACPSYQKYLLIFVYDDQLHVLSHTPSQNLPVPRIFAPVPGKKKDPRIPVDHRDNKMDPMLNWQ